ncbi:MAG TPA: ATP:cob(I)alamin adenosyltransferase, partial [Gemmatimonadetes bacterium]|nr:ATP:cob(I)alamin adenosyltransferase [Gemmatimonadota bacterium]
MGYNPVTHILSSPPRPKVPVLNVSRIGEIESWIDKADGELPGLNAFVLPGGLKGAAALHMARTVCRRAERAVVRLGTREDVSDRVIPYLNRLS